MRVYNCPEQRVPLFFENLACACGRPVAYLPEEDRFATDVPHCANREAIGCNWAAPAAGQLCAACALTITRPDATVANNTDRWAKAEAAKRWGLVGLHRWGWLTRSDPGPQPSFDILTEETQGGPAQLTMGHAEGHITINATEADPVEITRRREAMAEPYRTLVGHVRHELAHFLWWRLSTQQGFLDAFRRHFGDERQDYGTALSHHYDHGAPPDWSARHISQYASSHPHEDWAETAAHVMHLADLLHSAEAVDLSWAPLHRGENNVDPLTRALDLGLALNHLNRSIGVEDPYPFVVSDIVRTNLLFAWHLLEAGPSGKL